MNFEQLYDCGTRIEQAINSGQVDKNEGKAMKKTYGSGGSPNNQGGNRAVNPPSNSNIVAVVNQGARREFDDLGMSLFKAFANLTRRGHLQALAPRPLPNPIPPRYNLNEFCHFHQMAGHKTDNCARLRHEIQDLIDNKKIPKPREGVEPNIHQNPLPEYQRNVAFIERDTEMWDPSNLIKEVMVLDVDAWKDYSEINVQKGTFWDSMDDVVTEEDGILHLTRSGRHFKLSYLEGDHPGREAELERNDKKPDEEDDKDLCEVKGEEAEMTWRGFEIIQVIEKVGPCEIEKISPDFGEGVNHIAAHLMKKMNFMPGMGLGKYNQGVAEFPDFKLQNNRLGLGYNDENDGLPLNQGTLNGNFVKEGDDFPYCGSQNLGLIV
ncbi:hypothetical protein L1049_010796 [Liquidambar formosana]|uniref:G-patch domain-containing protein n=1 Tax=Liquidambar formosana TaxID=63359 RepID=A0AAP0WWL9_LIQFO